jgi:hypothetical protein
VSTAAEHDAEEGDVAQDDSSLPTIDFATFVLSLSHSALMHLGEAPHPDTDKVEANLPLAKQNIDLLGLLEEKTKGNLTGDEERLLAQVLFDLRMRYVERSKAPK